MLFFKLCIAIFYHLQIVGKLEPNYMFLSNMHVAGGKREDVVEARLAEESSSEERRWA